MVRVCVAHYAALTQRTARLTASVFSVFQTLRNDAVERAVRRFSAAQCGARARRARTETGCEHGACVRAALRRVC
eukprot:2745161-Lingulodinium_polyedra.AAC.1